MIRADVADEEKRLTIIDPKLANIILAVLVIEKIDAQAADIGVHQQVDGQVVTVGVDGIMELFCTDGAQAYMA